MTDQLYPKSQLPIRKTEDLLPGVFKTDANKKFMSAVVDPLVQPGLLEKTVGYVGRRYGKTYRGTDIYLDSDNSLRSRYQLEPGVISSENGNVTNFYDYIDFKNQLKFFGNTIERDDLITSQEHYSWNPPINWDKFINYREYFWEPNGPLPITVNGEANPNVVSEYTVSVDGHAFVFNSDSPYALNNPTLNLYRGQTYKFNVNAPGEGFVIRNKYDSGSLLYNNLFSYVDGQLAIYENQIIKAKHTIPSDVKRSIPDISLDSVDWEVIQFVYQSEIVYFNSSSDYKIGQYVVYDDFLWQATESIPASTITTVTTSKWRSIGVVVNAPTLDYTKGITNNGISNGLITFVVPYDSPDELFYQSPIDPDKFGRFIIDDISANTKDIDVTKTIIGFKNYTSGNGIVFSNGMVVQFRGTVIPKKYASDSWLVSGVGSTISLTRFSDLTTTMISKDVPVVMFDNGGFDTEPYDNAAFFPGDQDYITISNSSVDLNPWSRYNRWFHRSVLEYSCKLNGTEYAAPEQMRAKRPIIEFNTNLQLFNHGTRAKESVDAVDRHTVDVLSTIEGSSSYTIDGVELFTGARILVTADRDILTNNKIYEVIFVTIAGVRLIHLVEALDADPLLGECVLVRAGNEDGGAMYHYTGTSWVRSQDKISINQAPMFDIFDENEVSFSNSETYPSTNFTGSTILSYKVGNGRTDSHLGFSLSYLNINNIGDIQFNWDFGTDTFIFTDNGSKIITKLATGYYRNNFLGLEYANGWVKTDNAFIQPIIDSVVITEITNEINITPINFYESIPDAWVVKFYVNGEPLAASYTRDQNLFTFNTTFAVGDVISVKVISANEPDTGYYEIPVGLEKNPFNAELTSFTLGQADDHVKSAVDFHQRFTGTIPGISNLRDIDDYQQYATRFLKHSGISPLAISVLCDKEYNIIKALRYAKNLSTEFKNNFLDRAVMMPLLPVSDAVDTIIAELTKTKTVSSPFAYSDMVGSGAYTKLTYEVVNADTTTYALSNKFNLTDLSNTAVYVYVDRINARGVYTKTHLINTRDYQFNDVYGYVNITYAIQPGDIIEIREYVSTAINYIPTTPSSIGLYKAYTPMIFMDDTYTTPRLVIQGHDGSVFAAYGDYRDDLLLELELRIYNNIKQHYDPAIFDIDAILGGYYNSGMYTKQQLDDLVRSDFYKWISGSNVDHVHNTWYEELNQFTYTFNKALDPTRTQSIPGYWRGVYQWFYDTDRPHRCPWEMLGFSEEPTWWESEYGPAPYTSENFILWEDLRDGNIKYGDRKGINARYARPDLLAHIPVDANGKLIDPLAAGLANEFDTYTEKDNFTVGDIAPVEHSWRSSSDWPFVVSTALCLMKPFEYITDRFDISRIKLNKLGQTVHNSTSLFVTLDDIVIPSNNELSVGLGSYLVDLIKANGTDPSLIETKIKNLDVRLTTRLSGFAVLDQQKYLLDSKHQSTVGSVYVPPENVDIIFNVSSPIKTITYSGVIVEKTNGGWLISGYDNNNQYFKYYDANQASGDAQISISPVDTSQLLTVGGVSQPYSEWRPNVTYKNGEIVKYQTQFFKALRTNNTATFDNTYHDWQLLKNLPSVGEVIAYKRTSFNKFSIKILNYGTKLGSLQEVIDFLLGYEEYLKSIGFIFDGYDTSTQTTINWTTSCKELMFWTKSNWSEGSLISLSPIASKIEITMGGGVAESVVDGFYDYEILKASGQAFKLDELDITRSFQKIIVSPTSSMDGIYYLNLYSVLKEHVAVFSDRTVFNDVIYDKPTGYRQGRIKAQGYRTVDWDGDYTSPGFLFDNVSIAPWAAYTDYKMGDIVSYRSNNWTSSVNQIGTANFDDTNWTKLDSTPTKELIANFDYKINQFEDYYDVTSEGIGENQRSLARHAIGYQTRSYLQDLAADPVTQFQLYQGFIREKGTANAINKVFDKLSRSGDASITMNEEWAFRVGRFGGLDQLTEIEIQVEKTKFKLNPQAIEVASYITLPMLDQKYQVNKDNFTIAPESFSTNIHPVSYDEPVRTAGYVKTDQVAVTVKSKTDILSLDITTIAENDHVWVTFENYTWDVLRFNQTNLRIVSVSVSGSSVTLVLSDRHSLKVDDIIGVKPINVITNLVGFFRITAVEWNYITIDGGSLTSEPVLSAVVPLHISVLTTARFDTYDLINEESAAAYTTGSKLWIDNNSTGKWEVVEKQNTYVDYNPSPNSNYGWDKPTEGAGSDVLYIESLGQTLFSVPGSGYVAIYSGTSFTKCKHLIRPPVSFGDSLNSSFGMKITISPDNRFLAISAPLASNVRSNFKGEYSKTTHYHYGDIVIDDGLYWEATQDIPVDGSTDSLKSDDWRPATIIPANYIGQTNGYTRQGVISIYENSDVDWLILRTILSPDQQDYELFGSDISISGSVDGTYTMVVSTGNGTGRVYQYEYNGTIWTHNTHPTIEKQYNPVLRVGDLNPTSTAVTSVSVSGDCSTILVGMPNKGLSGEVYAYSLGPNHQYTLFDTISSLSGSSDGDKFGYKVALDDTGTTAIITSPNSDIVTSDQGSVYVLKRTTGEFSETQRLYSFDDISNEQFGTSMHFSTSGNTLVVGAKNTPYTQYKSFDHGTTVFDEDRTKIVTSVGSSGGIYVYEKKGSTYFLTAKPVPANSEMSYYESYGYAVACTDNIILVGSPTYSIETDGQHIGMVRLFVQDKAANSWNTIAEQAKVVDLTKIKSVELYDNVKNTKIQDLDYVDHAKLKVLNYAEQAITYKTLYDPAVYTDGIDDSMHVVEPSQAWADAYVGKLWWDVSTVKWVYAEQGDFSYRTGHWNQMATGSSVDIYEWVKTKLLPSEWAILADTNEGISAGISGSPLYPDDSVLTIKPLYNTVTGVATETYYYFWVKNKVLIPNGSTRTVSAADVSSAISNPIGTGVSFIAFTNANEILTYNIGSNLSSDTALINIVYYKDDKPLIPIHNEYQLLTEGVESSIPTPQLELKWLDSLIGADMDGNRVPNEQLPAKQRYGLSFRPRQSMFIDRVTVLKSAIEHINGVLMKEPFTGTADFSILNSIDEIPTVASNRYDTVVDKFIDLEYVNTGRAEQASIELSITNGKITEVTIISQGYGYKPSIPVYENMTVAKYNYTGTGYKGPLVTIGGDGVGAVVELIIDNYGRVIETKIKHEGKKYSTAIATVRPLSVLVNSDETFDNFWSIYEWNSKINQFSRTATQQYDTTRYWSYVDWWKTGYGLSSRIIKEIPSLVEINDLVTQVGDLIRIKEYENGGWAVFERIEDELDQPGVTNYDLEVFSDYYSMVGRENGTIQLSSILYSTVFGYDGISPFDGIPYDRDFTRELRNILTAVKLDIFKGQYTVEWNNLFFSGVRAAFAEQMYIDWAFKTSFITATHNVGPFKQTLNYNNDNISSFESYINEVKPYRTTVREYISKYDSIDTAAIGVADFDLPATYSYAKGKISPITNNSTELLVYPWKWWVDYRSYSVVNIVVTNPGSDYDRPPEVVISGDGYGATAAAFISNGKVSRIEVLTPGTGYLSAPSVEIKGGNPGTSVVATAVAFIGGSKARMFDLTLKFDRISKTGLTRDFSYTETFHADGNQSSFRLKYPALPEKDKIMVIKNDHLVLGDAYDIHMEVVNVGYDIMVSHLVFDLLPGSTDIITITYEKHNSVMDAVDRIEKYYNPTSGMRGKFLSQLVTGVDFGGVQIQGSTFDVTGGWDAMPWGDDTWDSIESDNTYYHYCLSTDTARGLVVTLPYIPAPGKQLNIYIKSADPERFNKLLPYGLKKSPYSKPPAMIRLDDIAYTPQWDSSSVVNPYAIMPTFIGDGIINTINIGTHLETFDGDILVFRLAESDGSIAVNDPSIIDTNMQGGSLSFANGAYATASGLTADEIAVDGGVFISKAHVPATEENVPGQVLESLSIKVFDESANDSAPLHSKYTFGDGVTKTFLIGMNVIDSTSVLVSVDNVKKVLGTDYTVDIATNSVVFLIAPISNKPVVIVSVGVGGVNIQAYNRFVADGKLSKFTTTAFYKDVDSVYVTVDGVQVSASFNGTAPKKSNGKTFVLLPDKPAKGSIVNVVCFKGTSENFNTSILQVKEQIVTYQGNSTITVPMFDTVPVNSAPIPLTIKRNNTLMIGVDTSYAIYDGFVNEFFVERKANPINTDNIKVYVNDELISFVSEYNFTNNLDSVIISKPLVGGDRIQITNDVDAQYVVSGNQITFDTSKVSMVNGDVLDITWFANYQTMQMIIDETVGGKARYYLPFTPLATSYLWIYKNNIQVVADRDYMVVDNYITFVKDTLSTDVIKIIAFGANLRREARAFEITKDMYNFGGYTRFAKNDVKLAQDLNYYDKSIVLTDASQMHIPAKQFNVPGIVYINGERIQYFEINGNTLTQLRRGVFGTSIPEVHVIDSYVVDVSVTEKLPYVDTEYRYDVISDGTNLIIPVDFIPVKSSRTNWERGDDTIPNFIPITHGPCDHIEVFVAGRRLSKNPRMVFNPEKGSTSPASDDLLLAEFSVDGTSPAIRLTDLAPVGTRVTVYRKTGKIWYEQGDNAASKGITLLDNTTSVAQFISQKSSLLPD
jgi:hypothetical protein